jgi:sporulation protein YlmC with PRC-barrel domain
MASWLHPSAQHFAACTVFSRGGFAKGAPMKFLTLLPVCALLALGSHGAFAQGTPQTIVNYRVDVTHVATGYRASKLVGASVYNDAKEHIGKIDDLIVTPNDRVFYAIVSVGGFLGMGDKLVAVPYNEIEVDGDRLVIPGATKDTLKTLPKFAYTIK